MCLSVNCLSAQMRMNAMSSLSTSGDNAQLRVCVCVCVCVRVCVSEMGIGDKRSCRIAGRIALRFV